MTPLSYDLVIQGKDLSRSNLPADAAGLAGFIAEIAPGAVRLESVNPLTAEPVIGRLQEAGLDAAMVRHGLKLTEFRLLASDLDSTLVAISQSPISRNLSRLNSSTSCRAGAICG